MPLVNPLWGPLTDYAASSTIAGWGGSYTVKVLKYQVGIGFKRLFVRLQLTGTGSGTTVTFTLPYTADETQVFLLHTKSNTTQAASYAVITAGSNTVTVSNSASSTTSWVTAQARDVEGWFEITIQ